MMRIESELVYLRVCLDWWCNVSTARPAWDRGGAGLARMRGPGRATDKSRFDRVLGSPWPGSFCAHIPSCGSLRARPLSASSLGCASLGAALHRWKSNQGPEATEAGSAGFFWKGSGHVADAGPWHSRKEMGSRVLSVVKVAQMAQKRGPPQRAGGLASSSGQMI
jgi:hypothetical protein